MTRQAPDPARLAEWDTAMGERALTRPAAPESDGSLRPAEGVLLSALSGATALGAILWVLA